MSRVNDQHFEVTVELSIFNCGEDKKAKDIEAAIARALLQGLPDDLDFGDVVTKVEEVLD